MIVNSVNILYVNKCFKIEKKSVLISLISDTLLIEQLIYCTDFWNWAEEKKLASTQPRLSSV